MFQINRQSHSTQQGTEQMSLLTKIQRGRASKPPRILVYGTEGIGKTTFASQTPSPIFIQTEDGMDHVASDRFPLAQTYDDVYASLRDIHHEPHDYGTLVVDSLDWLERLIFDRLTINPDGSAEMTVLRSNIRSTEEGHKAESEIAEYRASFDGQTEDGWRTVAAHLPNNPVRRSYNSRVKPYRSVRDCTVPHESVRTGCKPDKAGHPLWACRSSCR
jgi:hypothetical protein